MTARALVERWDAAPWWTRWIAVYLAALTTALLAGALGVGIGNAMFLVGALFILASVGFIGLGGERRFRIVRNLMGVPIAKDEIEPAKRQRQISTGVKAFLIGIALWLPLLWLALW